VRRRFSFTVFACGAKRRNRDARSHLSHKGRGSAPQPAPSLRANGSRECAPDDRLHEAIHLAAQRKNGLLRFARNDVTLIPDACPRSRGAKRPSHAWKFPYPPIRGRRECRAPDAPAAACAVVVSTRVSHHGHTGITRHSPRNGFNGCFVLSPVTGLSCHRHRRIAPPT
jgi:hypothetical protein